MILHCFYCDNLDSFIVNWHKKACNLAGIDVVYHTASFDHLKEQGISLHAAHGLWMEQVLSDSGDDLVGFIDIDCIIASVQWLKEYWERVEKTKTMLGVAQCANHLACRDHIYAAPAFLIVSAKWWKSLGKPSLVASSMYDTAQRLSARAEEEGCLFDILMPSHSAFPKWRLGNAGMYGTGTLYDDGKIFHLFECSKGQLFKDLLNAKVSQIQQGFNAFQP